MNAYKILKMKYVTLLEKRFSERDGQLIRYFDQLEQREKIRFVFEVIQVTNGLINSLAREYFNKRADTDVFMFFIELLSSESYGMESQIELINDNTPIVTYHLMKLTFTIDLIIDLSYSGEELDFLENPLDDESLVRKFFEACKDNE